MRAENSIRIKHPCTKRKLTANEQKTLKQLLRYTHLDTIEDPYYGNGCRMGGYYTDNGFKFNGKNYPMKFYGVNDGNTNLALEGFLLSISKRGKWDVNKKNYSFSAYAVGE